LSTTRMRWRRWRQRHRTKHLKCSERTFLVDTFLVGILLLLLLLVLVVAEIRIAIVIASIVGGRFRGSIALVLVLVVA